MTKMVISLVIEGDPHDIHEIKGQVLKVACEAIVSCSTNVIEEPEQKILLTTFRKGNAK